MNLKILLPSGIFSSVTGVTRIVAETREGAFGILPRRLDCVAALAPGILTYVTERGAVCLAADEGVLIKQGANVTVSVRHCIEGPTLDLMREAVRIEFSGFDQRNRTIRAALTKMEGGLVGRLLEMHRGR